MGIEDMHLQHALTVALSYLEARRRTAPLEQPYLDQWQALFFNYLNLLRDPETSAGQELDEGQALERGRRLAPWVSNLHPNRSLQDAQVSLEAIALEVWQHLQAGPHGAALPPPKIPKPKSQDEQRATGSNPDDVGQLKPKARIGEE